jgi:hypothetical protein
MQQVAKRHCLFFTSFLALFLFLVQGPSPPTVFLLPQVDHQALHDFFCHAAVSNEIFLLVAKVMRCHG